MRGLRVGVGAGLAIVTLWAASAVAQERPTGKSGKKKDCSVYLYIDDRGDSNKTRDLSTVPPEKRTSMITTQDCSFKGTSKGSFVYSRDETGKGGAERVEMDDADSDHETDRVSRAIAEGWFRKLANKIRRRAGYFLFCVAVIIGAWIGLLIASWRVGILWFLFNLIAALYFPPIVLVFVILYWREAKTPFFAYLAAYLAMVLLVVL